MKEHLKANILNFNWPHSAPTFYFSLDDIEESHPVHKSKFSKQIIEAFPNTDLSSKDVIFTTFTLPLKNAPQVKINLTNRKELSLYKQYLKHQLRTHFLSKGYIVVKNFVRNIQVWIPSLKGNTEHFNLYYKFSFKIDFAQLTSLPELTVAYDGTTKVLTKSVKDIEEVKWFDPYKTRVFF